MIEFDRLWGSTSDSGQLSSTWRVTELGWVWLQTMDVGSYKVWIRFSSRWWVVRLDRRVVGFIVMWTRTVCDWYWVLGVICFVV